MGCCAASKTENVENMVAMGDMSRRNSPSRKREVQPKRTAVKQSRGRWKKAD